MDDLLSKMQELLNSEEGQKQLQSVAAMLGSSQQGQQSSSDASAPSLNLSNLDLSSLSGMLSGMNQPQNSSQTAEQTALQKADGLGLDINTLLQVQKILGSMGQEDENTKLLMALKPHFSEKRREKIDQAVKMLRLLSVLPLLKDSGLLGGLFSNGK
jgi:hypothetical protein